MRGTRFASLAAMKIRVLQHAPHEGPAEIAAWAHQRSHPVAITHLYADEPFPALDSFDLLVVMGGEMNIYQDRDWPWLKAERELIEAALAMGRPVIGICLGAQLIADALGARVTQNPEIELGWYPVSFTPEARALYPDLPESAVALHWHGDTFELPDGATRLAVSAACGEQGFVVPKKCLGLQFHFEVDPKSVLSFVRGQGEWPRGTYVQPPEEVAANAETHHAANRQILFNLLDAFCAR
jgi:GMP synthase-like glutamine amidotransferase